MAKVAKKATKKVAKKKVARKTISKEEKQLRAEMRKLEAKQKKEQKLIETFQKNNDEFGKAVDEICKKFGYKAVMQGYDPKSEVPFTMGFNIKNTFEGDAMRFMCANTFKV